MADASSSTSSRCRSLSVRSARTAVYPSTSSGRRPTNDLLLHQGNILSSKGNVNASREALEKAAFASGYGVETGLLIDIFEQYGLRAIAQVDLQERIHHNQELEALGKMSFAIIQTVLRKLEPRYERSIIEEVNKTMKLIKYAKGGYYLEVEEVAERERPPMITIPAYRERFNK